MEPSLRNVLSETAFSRVLPLRATDMVSRIWRFADRAIVLSLHTEDTPSAQGWAEYLENCRQADSRNGDFAGVAGFVITDGGAPGHMQRAQINQLLKGRAVTSAIVSDATLVRVAVNALSLLNSKTKAFSASKCEPALAHIAVSSDRSKALLAQFDDMQRGVTKVRTLDHFRASLFDSAPSSP